MGTPNSGAIRWITRPTVGAAVQPAKANPLFVFKAGMVEGRVVNIADFAAIAAMPSKEELIAKVLFLLLIVNRNVLRNYLV